MSMLDTVQRNLKALKASTFGEGTFDSILVADMQEVACALRPLAPTPPSGPLNNISIYGVRVVESPLMPPNRFALVHRGEIVHIGKIGEE